MGNANYRQTTGNQYLTQDLRNFFQNDLPKFILQSKIGNGKFMKTYIMRIDSSPVVVKVYMKLNDEDLQTAAKNLTLIWKVLTPIKYPNLLPYQLWFKSVARIKSNALPVYLVRQFFSTNLYDRLSTRPFLNEIEKLFIVFQLLKCLEICHEHDIVHGDIKPENIMCTTSNWLILTDFSPFKPTLIPDDDPTDFQYYFDSMGRHRCYVAPERFYHRDMKGTCWGGKDGADESMAMSDLLGQDLGGIKCELFTEQTGLILNRSTAKGSGTTSATSDTNTAPLTAAMDVFSVGCVIAEIFLDGVPLLDLPATLQYVTGNSNGRLLNSLDEEESPVRSLLARIKNRTVREVVIDMTQRDPVKRLTISQYIDVLAGKQALPNNHNRNNDNKTNEREVQLAAFPGYFDSFLYPLCLKMHWSGVTPDDRVNIVCENYSELMRSMAVDMGKPVNDCGLEGHSTDRGVDFFTNGAMRSTYLFSDNRSHSIPIFRSATNKSEIEHLEDLLAVRKGPGGALFDENSTSTGGCSVAAMSNKVLQQRIASLNAARLRYDNKDTSGLGVASFSKPLYVKYSSSPRVASLATTSTSAEKVLSFLDYCNMSVEELQQHSNTLVERTQEIVPVAAANRSVGDALEESNALMSVALDLKFGGDDLMCRDTDLHFFNLSTAEGGRRGTYDGLVLVVGILNSNYRHLKFPQSKLVCLMLLTRLGLLCSDEVILQRVVPMLVVALEDQSAPVRAMALRALRSLLMVVTEFTHLESNFFPLYIFPALSRVAKDIDTLVKVAFAESVGRIAQISKRFLDTTHFKMMQRTPNESCNNSSVEADDCAAVEGSLELVEFPYHQKLEALKEQISRWIRDLIVDGGGSNNGVANGFESHQRPNANRITSCGGSLVKRVLLSDITRLCAFFGQESTMDRLLTQLLTFLNDPDWELRHAFCAKISAVCTFLGPTPTSECILPCIENAIYDVEEKVVVCALHCLASLAQLGLLSKFIVVDFTAKCKGLLLHPSDTIREAVLSFLCVATRELGHMDSVVFLLPEISDLLMYSIESADAITYDVLSDALVSPLPRRVFRNSLFQRLACMSSFAGIGPVDSFSQYTDKSFGSYLLGNSPIRVISESAKDSEMFDLSEVELASTSTGEMSVSCKLSMISRYLDLAAGEINTKTLQWRNGIQSGIYGSASSVLLDGLKARMMTSDEIAGKTRLSALLDLTSTNVPLPEHALQSLLVPHQKYGAFYFPTLADDLRRNSLYIDGDGTKNFNKLRVLFGVTASQADAARALAAGVGDIWDAQTSNGGGNGPSGTFQLGQGGPALPLHNATSLPSSRIASPPGQTAVGRSRLTNRVSTQQSDAYIGNSILGVSGGYSMISNPGGVVKLRSSAHPAYSESVVMLKRLKAMNIPPLPPDLGTLLQPDERKYSMYLDSLDTSSSPDAQSRASWRPKENVLLTSLREHSGSVNRLTVSPDQSFFASASSDRSVKVWQTKNLDRMAFPRSVVTYNKHRGAVLDMTVIENSHSIVSVSEDGAVHVWRVDMASSTGTPNNTGSHNIPQHATHDGVDFDVGAVINRPVGAVVCGSSVVRMIDSVKEGAITAVQHFNGDVASVVTYATQRGGIHGWDLRTQREAFFLPIRPELGQTTCMTIAPDRNWLAVGSSKGFISLFDIRFNVCAKLYRHSSEAPIHKLACCKSLVGGSGGVYGSAPVNVGSSAMPNTEGAYLFVASGQNEVAVWGIPEAGECYKCFRTVSLDASRAPVAPLPHLREVAIPRHPLAPVSEAMHSVSRQLDPSDNQSVRAIIGRISQSNASYLVTAGTDRSIRFWDFVSSAKCYTISGLDAAQPKSIYDMPKMGLEGSAGQLFVCYVAATPSADKILQAHLPIREGRGVGLPSTNSKDAILDLKNIDLPIRLMVSSSSDGEIKLWR